MAMEHLSDQELQQVIASKGDMSQLPDSLLERVSAPEGKPYIQHTFDEGVTPVAPLGYAADAGKFAAKGLGDVAQGAADTAANSTNPLQRGMAKLLGPAALIGQMSVPTTDMQVAGAVAAPKVLGAIGEGVNAFKNPETQKLMAEAAQASAAIPQRTTMAVLKDPDILSRAKSIADATSDYIKTIPGLQNVSEYMKTVMGKHVPTLSDFTAIVDDVGSRLGLSAESLAQHPELAPTSQEAMNVIQATNKILGHKEFPYDADIVRNLLK